VELESIVRALTLYLAAGVEVGAAAIVGFAAGEAMAQAVRGLFKGEAEADPKEEIRLRLARWLALAIEFELAADIIRTMIAPTWNEIGQLAAIIVIRTALNYFLRQETQGAGMVTERAPLTLKGVPR
jgi:uncharacterized membrane protein